MFSRNEYFLLLVYQTIYLVKNCLISYTMMKYCDNLSLIFYCFLQAEIEKLVNSMGGIVQTKTSVDVSFVVVKNVLAAKYKVGHLKVQISKNL